MSFYLLVKIIFYFSKKEKLLISKDIVIQKIDF